MSESNNVSEKKLLVRINSFSYKQGIPADDSGNGGGFVFDCRGILNPGRIDEYKKQTGRDEAVKKYLQEETRMHEFLDLVHRTISITVEDYLVRDFENLIISFGCTGGQHRSVYSADVTAAFLQKRYGVKTIVHHVVQEAKNWVN